MDLLHIMVDLLFPLCMEVEGTIVYESILWIEMALFLAEECPSYWVESIKELQLLDMDVQDIDQL